MKNIHLVFLYILLLAFFTGCATMESPDYSSFNSTLKPTSLKSTKIPSSRYHITDYTNVEFDIAGYSKILPTQTFEGDYITYASQDSLNNEIKAKIPFFSSTVKLDFNTDRCGNPQQSYANAEVINSGGTKDYKTSQELNNNPKARELLGYITKSRQSVIACNDWEAGEIKNSVQFFNFIMSNTVLGDKLTSVPEYIPVKYHGLVPFKGKEYLYFSVTDGKTRIDSQTFNEDVGHFKVNVKAVVNPQTLVAEHLEMRMTGNIYLEGHSVNLTIKKSTYGIQIKE